MSKRLAVAAGWLVGLHALSCAQSYGACNCSSTNNTYSVGLVVSAEGGGSTTVFPLGDIVKLEASHTCKPTDFTSSPPVYVWSAASDLTSWGVTTYHPVNYVTNAPATPAGSYTCAVDVTIAPECHSASGTYVVVEVTGVTASETEVSTNKDIKFTATLHPDGAYGSLVSWSGDDIPAGISGKELTTNWSIGGPKTVTAKCGTSSASKNVTVVSVDSINVTKCPLPPGDSCQATASTTPSGRAVTWSIVKMETYTNTPGNPPVSASVDGATGVVKADSASGKGRVRLKATDNSVPSSTEGWLEIGCPGCATCKKSGSGYILVGSVDVGMSLGQAAPEVHAGFLSLKAETPSPELATPRALTLDSIGSRLVVFRDPANGNALRQVMAPECLADIVTNSEFKYTVSFYRPADVEREFDANGLYAVSNKSPYAQWTFENPGGATNANVLRVTQCVDSNIVENEYVCDSQGGTNSWTLATGNGLRSESLVHGVDGADRVDTRTVKDGSGAVASKTRVTWRTFGWRAAAVATVTDPDGAALATTMSYYDEPSQTGSYGRAWLTVSPDGAWSRKAYDALGRMTQEVKPWQDAATNAAESKACVTAYAYSPVDTAHDGGTVFSNEARTVTESVLGVIVAKTYRSYYLNASGERVEVEERCADVGAAYGAAGNQRTTRVYDTGSGPGGGKLKSMTYPDGRQDAYAYENGTYETNADPSQCHFTAGSGDYMQATVIHGTTNSSAGIAYKTTKEATVEDALGRTVLQETYAYDGSGYQRIAWTVTCLNDRGRETDVYRSDGTHSESTWACCGKESEKDGNGTEHGYAYDALKRLIVDTKQGVWAGEYPVQEDLITSYTYDAEGRRLAETVSAGGLNLVTSNRYDTAGRLVESTDAAGLVTTYAYANGGLVETVTQPGGATRITERQKDGKTRSVTGTAVVAQYYEYRVETNGCQWTKVYTGSSNSPMWQKTTTDLLGRTVKVEKPGFGGTTEIAEYAYNGKGQMTSQTSTFGSQSATTLYEHDEMGNQVRSGLDVNTNGVLDLASMDRITEQGTAYEGGGADWWQVSSSAVYATNGSSVATTNQATRTRLKGFAGNVTAESRSVDVLGNETVSLTTVDRANKKVTQTVKAPGTGTNVTVTVNGLVQAATGGTGHTTTYAYDALGRQTGGTDPRTGTSTIWYDGHGWVDHVVDAAGNVTSNSYDSATGRRIGQTDPLGHTTYSSYTVQGQLEKTWGSGTYPVSYAYDGYGRMAAMSTYRGGSGWDGPAWPSSTAGTADTTTWRYDEATGLLTNKLYADTNGVSYAYGAGGRLAARTWARKEGGNGLVTTYAYDPITGDMTGISYSGTNTPAVTFAYDRLGRQKTVGDGAGGRTFAYGSNLQLASETVTGLYGRVLTRFYDSYGRPSGIGLDSGYQVGYGYDGVGRFSSLTASPVPSVTNAFSYSYLADSDLISGLSESGSGLGVSRSYEDHRNLLTNVQNAVGATAISRYDYVNDAAGRRTSVKNSGTAFGAVGAAFNVYSNNARGELIAAERYFGSNLNDQGNPVAGQAFAYAYDNIGNRTSADEGALVGRTSTYVANSLNQYGQRMVPDKADVIGSASTGATVTVNNEPVARQGVYFHKALSVSNAQAAAYELVSVVGVRKNAGTNGTDVVSTETGHVFAARNPEAFAYDEDGNLLSDGRFAYSWDGENRLVGVETRSGLPASVPRQKLAFAYDYMGRRVSKQVSNWAGGQWVAAGGSVYVYDGWNLVEEVRTQSAAVGTNSYAWGLDLSGTLQGAGGIGGLLLSHSSSTSNPVLFYAYDANGNVGQLLDAASGAVAAHYEYGPYGNVLVATGPEAAANPFRFSTKYTDPETGSIYYGYRFYSPSLGRWLSRDPIADSARQGPDSTGRAPYVFLGNGPANTVDPFGLIAFHFDVTVGNLAGWLTFADKWGQPAGCAEGDFSIGGNSTYAGVGVHSKKGDCCNSVFKGNPFKGGTGVSSGTINVYAIGDKCESSTTLYLIKVQLTVAALTSGKNTGGNLSYKDAGGILTSWELFPDSTFLANSWSGFIVSLTAGQQVWLAEFQPDISIGADLSLSTGAPVRYVDEYATLSVSASVVSGGP